MGGGRGNNWLTNAVLGAAIAENAPVMTAAGFHRDSRTGEVTQNQTEADRQLADNIAKIGAAGAIGMGGLAAAELAGGGAGTTITRVGNRYNPMQITGHPSWYYAPDAIAADATALPITLPVPM